MNENIFVEQAEYLNDESFKSWSIEHPHEETIIKKLSHSGAKLITGPRGSGKTTLMLKTYYKLCSTNNSTLPIYVNYKSSLKIEPLYKVNASAIFWFNQWTLFKVYLGLYKTLDELGVKIDLKFKREAVSRILNNIEFRNVEILVGEPTITIDSLEEEIISVLKALNKTHCVLLLDDAAHAFSPEQQRDFFEFFRQIKSRHISPKAAVYPGVTIYSSTFHVGHDAEEIDIWLNPESKEYIKFMFELLERRLPEAVFEQLLIKSDLLEIVCYSAFGMPRSLLNMVRTFYKENEETGEYTVKFTKTSVSSAIKSVLQQTMKIYSSLKVKLPTYEKFIDSGQRIYFDLIQSLKEYNKGKETNVQAVTVAVSRPIPQELIKVLGFFQYGGLLVPKGDISKGEKGIFDMFTLHYGFLVENNCFVGDKNISTEKLHFSLSKRNAHSFKRIAPSVLIGNEDIETVFPLSLPPCQFCKSPRISEHTKFCHECGSPLKTFSIFEKLVSSDISALQLTSARVRSIKEHSNIRTIKDILMDIENRELRSVPQIGSYWAQRIFSYAEEYIV